MLPAPLLLLTAACYLSQAARGQQQVIQTRHTSQTFQTPFHYFSNDFSQLPLANQTTRFTPSPGWAAIWTGRNQRQQPQQPLQQPLQLQPQPQLPQPQLPQPSFGAAPALGPAGFGQFVAQSSAQPAQTAVSAAPATTQSPAADPTGDPDHDDAEHATEPEEEARAARNNRAVANNKKNNNNNYNAANGDQGYQSYGAFVKDCLQTHDKYRAVHGAAPLKSSKKVMRYARKRAKELADTDHFAHPLNSPYGENLAFSSFKGTSCADLMKMWYDEISLYDWTNPSFNSEIGHFTQLVWKDSTKIGCARGFSKRGKGVYLVCNYDPPGNVFGEFRSQVSPQRRLAASATPAPVVSAPATFAPTTTSGPASISLATTTSALPVATNSTIGAAHAHSGTNNGHNNKKNKKNHSNNKKRKQQKQKKQQQAQSSSSSHNNNNNSHNSNNSNNSNAENRQPNRGR